MFFRLHFVLNLLTFALEKFVKLGTIEWWWPWRAYNFSELGSLLKPVTPLSMIPCREFRVAREKDSVIVYFLVEFDTWRCCCKERYFFVSSREFPTFIHHRRRWFSLEHVSVERGEESEEKQKAKSDVEKLLLLLFISLSFISFLFHELLWKKREENEMELEIVSGENSSKQSTKYPSTMKHMQQRPPHTCGAFLP